MHSEIEEKAIICEVWDEILARGGELIKAATGDDLIGHVARRPAAREVLVITADCAADGVTRIRSAVPDAVVSTAGPYTNFEERAYPLIVCYYAIGTLPGPSSYVERLSRALACGGELIVLESHCVPGGGMLPETRSIVNALWKTLPARFRVNHARPGLPRVDAEPDEPALPPGEGTETLFPLLARHFEQKYVVPHHTISRRFFEAFYGPNYHLDRPLDRALFEWIWELDNHYRSRAELPGESVFAIYGSRTRSS